jgi:chromate reductase
MRLLALSGSLRAGSSNTALLEAARDLAPDGVDVVLYLALGDLPHFNPDLDTDEPPPSVASYRAALAASDGIVISSPEYAHGVPGMFKNALDWVVGSGEFVDKPTAVINASPRASHAQASLLEILSVMSARLVPEASITLPLLGRILPPGGMLADPEIAEPLRTAISALVDAVA